jgi:flagellar motor protein MotB
MFKHQLLYDDEVHTMKKHIIIVISLIFLFTIIGTNLFAQQEVIEIKDMPVSISLYLGGAYLSALGNFSDIVNYGYGLSGGIIIHNILFPSCAINLAGGAFTYDAAHDAIESFTQYKGELFLGYTLHMTSSLEFIPYVGVGYYFNDLQGSDSGYDWQMYNDPYVGIKIECAYYIIDTLSFRLAPEFDIFFEEDNNTGFLFSIALAFSYSFSLPSGSEQKIGRGITKIETRDKITLSTAGLVFAPYKETLVENNEADKRNNRLLIDKLAEEIKKYPGYRITITGHAVNLLWYNAEKAAREEENLEILSKARAELIKTELVKRGVDPSRITTAGMGGKKPLFPFSDEENQWKNRRVEITLTKE